MLEHLSRLAVRGRFQLVALAVGIVLAGGLVGGTAVGRLRSGGFTDPGAPSSRAADLLHDRFGAGAPNFVLVVTAPPGRGVDDEEVRRVGADLAIRLAGERDVQQVVSYWPDGGPPSLRSADGKSALLLAQLAGNENQVERTAGELGPRYSGGRQGVAVRVAGSAAVDQEINHVLARDLHHAESYAFPLTLLLLLVVFGSVVAAILPLIIGVVSVAGTLVMLWMITGLVDVSVFALNVTTALGLGLAIDYSLFIVNRFREQLAAGVEPTDAVVHSVCTAGRTVIYSATTVALSLAAMLAFPQPFLRSLAFAGVAVVLLAAFAAVIVLPALLAIIGRRVDAWPVRWRQPHARHAKPRRGAWTRIALAVMRHPIPVVAVAVALLLVLGAPFFGVRFGLSDDRVLPTSAQSRQASGMLRTSFGAREQDALVVVSTQPVSAGDFDAYAARLSRLAHVARVDGPMGIYTKGRLLAAQPEAAAASGATSRGGWISVVPAVDSFSPAAEQMVRDVRALPAPVPVLVGGPPAVLVDTRQAISNRLPLALALVTVAVGALLFLFTGGLLVPVKAMILNLLSLTATFGSMVWVFQDGHLRHLLGNFTATGTIDVTVPVLMFCVAFGLSMDYEVFLLSRIREEWDRTRDNTSAVAAGLERTGRVVTAAALLVSVVFLSFATSGVTTLKMLGVGLAVAVLVDASVVRAALVPALMRLAGPANWWAPPPLRRLHARFGLHEKVPDPSARAATPTSRPVPITSRSTNRSLDEAPTSKGVVRHG